MGVCGVCVCCVDVAVLFSRLKRLHFSLSQKGVHPDLLILTEITKYTEDLGDW